MFNLGVSCGEVTLNIGPRSQDVAAGWVGRLACVLQRTDRICPCRRVYWDATRVRWLTKGMSVLTDFNNPSIALQLRGVVQTACNSYFDATHIFVSCTTYWTCEQVQMRH